MKTETSIKKLDRIIEMAWEDRTPFETISFQFGISESETITIMRTEKKFFQSLEKKSEFWC
jgi:uncharacterized protein (TIGR03643 family)